MTDASARIVEFRPRRFRQYPEYKDSGVTWLGRVPTNWRVRPLKHMTAFSTGWTPPTGRDDFYAGEHPWANISDLGPRILSTTEKSISDAAIQEARLKIVEAGSLLFSFKLSIGAVSITGVDMYTNEAIAAFSPSSLLETKYLFWAAPILILHNAQDNIYGAPLLNHERIANAKLLCPPVSEQRAIAAFLHRRTAKIDGLVARKRRLIELLQEKRAALTTHAVTRGLDSNVPIKDSGVEWLGEIPAHWDVKRLWHLTPRDRKIMYGIVLPGPNVDVGVPIVKGGDVATRLKLDALSRTSFEIEARYVRSRLRGGDLVYAIRGSIGEVEVVPDELEGANLTQDAARVAYTRATHGYWLLHALRSKGVFGQLEAGALGATIKGINIRDLKRARLPVPPWSEQREIASFLNAEAGKFEELSSKIRTAINHLTEYRTALISAAVTGKIDVRKEAA
ncbi:MAG: restriction endonuclease subunit S [Acidobacteria bacterium]|nr:restriction endonuclease subunit S [Acidobacteriota bacterium]